MTTDDGDLSIDFNVDFRNFLWDENLYNDELSQFGLIMSNLASGKRITLKQKNKTYGTMDITQYMTLLGFKEVENYEVYNENNIKVSCYIGYKSIDYYGKKRGVIGIFLNTNESVEAYRQLVVEKENLHINSIYTEIAKNVYSKVDTQKLMKLESKYELDYCYFVSGKGIAGGVAGEVSSIIRGTLRIDGSDSNKNIYCYTYGSPKTHIGYSNVNSFIKNIINEDDLIPKILNKEDGYGRVGTLYNDSIYTHLQREYKELTNGNTYSASPKLSNSIEEKVKKVRGTITLENFKNLFNDAFSSYLQSFTKITQNFNHRFNSKQAQKLTELKSILNGNIQKIKNAHEIKSYYVLSKTLNGFDLNNSDESWEQCKEEVISEIDIPDDEYEHIYIEIDWQSGYPPDKAQLEMVTFPHLLVHF